MVTEGNTAPTPADITVVGCGHLGLVMAAGFAELGHRVVGIDRNAQLVDSLCHG
jgi:UDP-glucose 6-dehydrogenase